MKLPYHGLKNSFDDSNNSNSVVTGVGETQVKLYHASLWEAKIPPDTYSSEPS